MSEKLMCACGRKGRLIVACKSCCPTRNFGEYKGGKTG
jgi:hypothetical protein